MSSLGDVLTNEQLECADDLFHLRIPRIWSTMARSTLPPPNQALGSWLSDLSNRYQHLDRMLSTGREKMPAYWLGAFFYPRGLLALLRQDHYRHFGQERGGLIEQFVFQTEITARDKDHVSTLAMLKIARIVIVVLIIFAYYFLFQIFLF